MGGSSSRRHGSSRSSRRHGGSSRQQGSSSRGPRSRSEESIHLSDSEQGEWRLEEVEEVDPDGRVKTHFVRRWIRWGRSDQGPAEYLHDVGTGGRLAPGQPYTTSNAPVVEAGNSSGGAGYPPQRIARSMFSGRVNRWRSGLPADPTDYTSTPVAGSYSSSDRGYDDGLRVDDDANTYSMPLGQQQYWASAQWDQRQAVGHVEGGTHQGGRPHQARAGQWCWGGLRCAGWPACTCRGGESCRCDE